MRKRRAADAVLGDAELDEVSGVYRRFDATSRPDRSCEDSRVGLAWPARPLVGECLDDFHPTLHGRVCVRISWTPSGEDGTPRRPVTVSRWVPVLQGVVVREGDRVLLEAPANWSEPVVVGVLDGFTPRPPRPTRAAASLDLRSDEVFEIRGNHGRPLVEICERDEGPLVRILHADANLELEGTFSLRAQCVSISAEEDLALDAEGSMRLSGDTIDLN